MPKRIFRICEIEKAPNGVFLDGVFFEGEKIRNRLSDCKACALFAVTLGAESEALLRRYAISHIAKATVMQAVLADLTEDVCDLTEKEIKKQIDSHSTLTLRFSPGYPGLPLSYQPLIFSMLEITKRIGIFLTDSYMMTPSKSVTAFAGIKEIENQIEKSEE